MVFRFFQGTFCVQFLFRHGRPPLMLSIRLNVGGELTGGELTGGELTGWLPTSLTGWTLNMVFISWSRAEVRARWAAVEQASGKASNVFACGLGFGLAGPRPCIDSR